MGSVIKRGRRYSIRYVGHGKIIQEPTGSTNKRVAEKLLAMRETEVLQGRFDLVKSHPPMFRDYAENFLSSVQHPNTLRRYRSSICNLNQEIGNTRLSHITPEIVEAFKSKRLGKGVRTATVNRDLAVLRRILRLAERRRLIGRSSFAGIEMLEERKQRRKAHILTFEEEEKLLAGAPPHIRALAVLILETGLRSNKEALALRWEHVDFERGCIRVMESKTAAGERSIPMSDRCKAELLGWRALLGPEFSNYVFPNMRNPREALKDVRKSWTEALRKAGLPHFWMYDLRHTLASRLTAAGVSPIFVAQIIGHSSTSIINTYALAIDEYRRDAIQKLQTFRNLHTSALHMSIRVQ